MRILTMGHSARSPPDDHTAWALCWVLQAAVLLRVMGVLWSVRATAFAVLSALA